MAATGIASVKFDATVFKAKAEKLSREWKVDIRHLLHDQMRLWAIWCLKNTPPGAEKSDQQKMQKKVNSDIRRIIQGMNTDGMLFILKQRFGGGARGRKRAESVYDGAHFSKGSLDELADWHKQHRTASGRVKFTPRKVGELRTNTNTSMPVFNKMYVPMAALNRYLKQELGRVGILMSGWLPAIDLYSRLARKSATNRDTPAWVRKAGGTVAYVKGGASDSMFNLDTAKGYMWMSHSVPWNGMLNSVLQRGADVRQRDMIGFAAKRIRALGRRWEVAA